MYNKIANVVRGLAVDMIEKANLVTRDCPWVVQKLEQYSLEMY